MMSTKTTKSSVLALARKKYGPKAELRHNPKALDAAGREVVREEVRSRQARKAQLEAERKAIVSEGDPRVALRAAARFAVDVDGDEPSWTLLRVALEREERLAAISEELREITTANDKGTGLLLRRRWEITRIVVIAGMPMCEGYEREDTLEALEEKLRGS